MIDNEELVIRYLTDELTLEEKRSFEQLLKGSDDMQKLLNDYSLLFDKLNKQKNITGNEYYFNNLLPRLFARSKEVSRRLSLKSISYAAVIILFMISGYFLFEKPRSENIISLESITSEIDSTGLAEIIDKYSIADDSYIPAVYLNTQIEIDMNNLNENLRNNLSSELDITEITNNMNLEEIESVYSELLSKKIL